MIPLLVNNEPQQLIQNFIMIVCIMTTEPLHGIQKSWTGLQDQYTKYIPAKKSNIWTSHPFEHQLLFVSLYSSLICHSIYHQVGTYSHLLRCHQKASEEPWFTVQSQKHLDGRMQTEYSKPLHPDIWAKLYAFFWAYRHICTKGGTVRMANKEGQARDSRLKIK